MAKNKKTKKPKCLEIEDPLAKEERLRKQRLERRKKKNKPIGIKKAYDAPKQILPTRTYLTDEEMEIAIGVAEGKTKTQIFKDLNISERRGYRIMARNTDSIWEYADKVKEEREARKALGLSPEATREDIQFELNKALLIASKEEDLKMVKEIASAINKMEGYESAQKIEQTITGFSFVDYYEDEVNEETEDEDIATGDVDTEV